MTILITGGDGFVGSATKKNGDYEWQSYDLMKGYDIRDYDQLERYINKYKPDRILHLAAIARFAEADKDPKLAFETNVIGTKIVAQLAGKYHIPIVYASTGSVYMPILEEPPITEEFRVCGNSVYGCTKYLGELYIKELSSAWIIFRYAHLYGKEKRHHGLIGGFVERIQKGLQPTLYGGRQSNDFTYIKDVARANLLALTASWDSWNQTYNIGTGEELTAQEAGEMICEEMNYNRGINCEESRTVDPQRFVYSIKKTEEMLGFKAEFDFKSGLKDMFSYDTDLSKKQ